MNLLCRYFFATRQRPSSWPVIRSRLDVYGPIGHDNMRQQRSPTLCVQRRCSCYGTSRQRVSQSWRVLRLLVRVPACMTVHVGVGDVHNKVSVDLGGAPACRTCVNKNRNCGRSESCGQGNLSRVCQMCSVEDLAALYGCSSMRSARQEAV